MTSNLMATMKREATHINGELFLTKVALKQRIRSTVASYYDGQRTGGYRSRDPRQRLADVGCQEGQGRKKLTTTQQDHTMSRTDTAPDKIRDFIHVAPSCIELDPKFLAREKPVDDEAVDRMVASLRKFGQLQPIRARKVTGTDGEQRLCAIFGATRTRAGQIIEAEEPSFRLHVHVVKVNEEEAFLMAVEENRQRNKTTPIDDGLNARRLMDSYDWDKARVAGFYGLESTQAVDNLLNLLTLPTTIRNRVSDGTLPASVALQHLVGLPDAEVVAIVKDAEAAVLSGDTAMDASQVDWDADSEGRLGVDGQSGQIEIPFGDPAPETSEFHPDGAATDFAPATETAGPADTSKPAKVPKVPKFGKDGNPKLTGRQVAAAKRSRGGTAKRTWTDVRGALKPRGDVVSKSILEFADGLIDERELDRVLDEASTAMRRSDGGGKKAVVRQPIRQLS